MNNNIKIKLKIAASSSIAVLLLKGIYLRYRHLGLSLNKISCGSATHNLFNKLWGQIKIIFRYSFLGRITETGYTGCDFTVLHESVTVQKFKKVYGKFLLKLDSYFRNSNSNDLFERLKKELSLSSIKTISIIIIPATMINMLLSLFIGEEIGFWGWFLRLLILFIAFSGLFSHAKLEEVKKTSYFIIHGDRPF